MAGDVEISNPFDSAANVNKDPRQSRTMDDINGQPMPPRQNREFKSTHLVTGRRTLLEIKAHRRCNSVG